LNLLIPRVVCMRAPFDVLRAPRISAILSAPLFTYVDDPPFFVPAGTRATPCFPVRGTRPRHNKPPLCQLCLSTDRCTTPISTQRFTNRSIILLFDPQNPIRYVGCRVFPSVRAGCTRVRVRVQAECSTSTTLYDTWRMFIWGEYTAPLDPFHQLVVCDELFAVIRAGKICATEYDTIKPQRIFSLMDNPTC
jgi:hypothetical protein